jgi:hypothetical protein
MKTYSMFFLLLLVFLTNTKGQSKDSDICFKGKFYRTNLDMIKINDLVKLIAINADTTKFEEWYFMKGNKVTIGNITREKDNTYLARINGYTWNYNEKSSMLKLKLKGDKQIIVYSLIKCDDKYIELKKIE